MNEKLKNGLHPSWYQVLKDEFQKEYIVKLRTFLESEIKKGKIIYPHGNEIFSALNLTPLNEIKVVIIGQDPYHNPNQAHGLSFSVKPKVPPPPSLCNIYKELKQDLGFKIPNHGSLVKWAKQGVLLLNAVLTVEKNRPASHQNKGWENLTDTIVDYLNREKDNLVFMLWGAHAQKKCNSVDSSKHLVIKSPHPSPFSADRGFFGSRPFSKANDYLNKNKKPIIDWQL